MVLQQTVLANTILTCLPLVPEVEACEHPDLQLKITVHTFFDTCRLAACSTVSRHDFMETLHYPLQTKIGVYGSSATKVSTAMHTEAYSVCTFICHSLLELIHTADIPDTSAHCPGLYAP